MRMQRRQFRIGELAKLVGVEKFVIRFWEKEFYLKTTRSDGGQRFYSDRDVKRFQFIKELLYKKGFTIDGARKHLKKQLESRKIEFTTAKAAHKNDTHQQRFYNKITMLQRQLVKLKKLLP